MKIMHKIVINEVTMFNSNISSENFNNVDKSSMHVDIIIYE
jgi:hypothetical protein